jgi:hypothetical protein
MTQQLADRQTALMQAIARKLRSEADAEGAKGGLFGRSNGMPEVRSPASTQKHYGEQSQAQAEGEQPDQQAEPAAIRHFLPGEQQQDLSNKRQAIES